MELKNEYIAIYELNSKTPLFSRIANNEINNGNFEEAISILKKGIELFEDYPTPYFLLGKALQKIGNSTEADIYINQGNSRLSNYSHNHVISKIEVGHFETNLDSDLENSTDNNLEELADKLKVAKIEVDYSKLNEAPNTIVENEESEFKPLKGLVSETLASIYFDQANYKEAKAIYETLIDIQPERAEYFRTKISQIESKMRS